VFWPSVRELEDARGSRRWDPTLAARGGFRSEITPDLAEFVAQRDSFFLATASASGQPYVQHRGGPKGFLRVLDGHTLGFADYRGNRQYVTVGNLAENDRAFIFLMDYAQRQRIKLWGRARVVEDDAALLQRLMPEGYKAHPEQAILFAVEAWDANCPQHIPRLHADEDVARMVADYEARIAALEAKLRG
jgi:predicted pyridoxine 5'-phosphate oxidase superfamily flavin-nucleotide-binding protein